MCCNLQTHVKVIAIVCIILRGLGLLCTALPLVFSATESGPPNAALALGGSMLAQSFWLVCDVLCLRGATKKNKCLLIPFMICQCLAILACIGFGIVFIYLGATVNSGASYNNPYEGNATHVRSTSLKYNNINDEHFATNNFRQNNERVEAFVYYLNLSICLLGLGLSIYFLVIVTRFYKELSLAIPYNNFSSGIPSEQVSGMVMPPLTPNQGGLTEGGFSTIYSSSTNNHKEN